MSDKMLRTPDEGLGRVLKSQIRRLTEELDELKKAAIERGREDENRALEA